MATTTKGYPYPTGTDRVMEGDDAIAALATDVDTKLGTSASGTVTFTGVSPGVAYNLAVTFPAGRFGAAPNCQATASGSSANQHRQPCISAVGATSMTVYAGRDAGTGNITLQWLAVRL